MASYNIKQIAYMGKSHCLTSYPSSNNGEITPINIEHGTAANQPGDWGDQYAPYQQVILNSENYNSGSPKSFLVNTPYYLKLTIPRDENYDLDFALLLIPQFQSNADLDQLNYQFVRYIHVPKTDFGNIGESRVILYEWPQADGSYTGDPANVKVAIAKNRYNEDGSEIPPPANSTTNIYYSVDNNGNYTYWRRISGKWQECVFGKNDVTLTHSWVSNSSNEFVTYEYIFTPKVEQLYYLYLYLIPTKADNDIQWTSNQKTYYGRHIDITQMQIELYQINNLLGNITARRFGIWGRSELMFTINGEEIKIGPSQYYELRDFPVSYLGVAAMDNKDQFTIDIQY